LRASGGHCAVRQPHDCQPAEEDVQDGRTTTLRMFEEIVMALPEIATREQWLQARLRLLAEEEKLTRRRDALNAQRRRLPMVRVTKDYVLDGAQGSVTYRAGKGWTLPWYSSCGSDFNDDFQVTLDESAGQLSYHYPRAWLAGRRAFDGDAGRELLPARRRRGLPHVLRVCPGP
jgi:predicted dithiol-disulfide oxidoreductase (DUF899 family)